MVNIEVKEFKIKLNKRTYTFRLDFKALLKFTNRYENGLDIFNDFLTGKNVYDCIVKVLSCACVEKDFTEEELTGLLSFNFETMKLMDEITFALIQGIMQEKDEKEDEEVKN